MSNRNFIRYPDTNYSDSASVSVTPSPSGKHVTRCFVNGRQIFEQHFNSLFDANQSAIAQAAKLNAAGFQIVTS